MEQPPDLLTPLSEIIGYSDNELQSPSKWYLDCRITLERSVYDEPQKISNLWWESCRLEL
ncbi:hypothetical protein QPK80_07380 [Providencia rettgeri]|nr:hypothetical protein [Providencia rettgeri]